MVSPSDQGKLIGKPFEGPGTNGLKDFAIVLWYRV